MYRRRGPRTPAQAALTLAIFFGYMAFYGLGGHDRHRPDHRDVHYPNEVQAAAHVAPPPGADPAHHGVHVQHAPPRGGEPFPSWVPMVAAGGTFLGILGLGAAGTVLLLRREPEPEPEPATAPTDGTELFDDPELLALVRAHEAKGS